ncbi:MAG TPA: flagellar basal body-associated protein FliL [Paucimonas sp.]|nr:flagellar basal body-associated protein FliL [Paucimonas sp.]HJW55006.1 flagellar basal body-associated protein FliL [Burkholderiaceae bacterium]
MATSASRQTPKAAATNLQAVPAAGEDAPPAKRSRKKLVVIIVIALFVLGLGGFAAWYFMSHGDDASAKSAKDHAKHEPAKLPVFLPMDAFTVNLQNEGVEQFLQVSFTLQMDDPEQVELIKLYMPQVRSRLLLLLSSKKASEISSVEGKKKLSEEILAQVKQPFSAGAAPQKISNVFFTSFVIQ